MAHDTDIPIRLRPDGSIDTAYYMARGRQKRSEQARDIAKAMLPEKRERRKTLWGIFAF